VSSAIIISISRASRFITLPSLAMASICCCKTCSHKVEHNYYIKFSGLKKCMISYKWLMKKISKKCKQICQVINLRLVSSYLLQVSQTLIMNFGWARKMNGVAKSIAISLDTRYTE
jgi:hypothetical protein